MQVKTKTSIDTLTKIQISIISVMFVWKIIPQFYYIFRGPIWAFMYQFLFLFWLAFSFLRSGIWLRILKNETIPIVLFIIYVLIEGFLFPNVQPGYLALVMSFWEIAIIYYYYSNVNVSKKACRIVSAIVLATMLIGTFQSIQALGANSMAVREASSSNLNDVSLMAGNYTFTAMLTIVVPVLILIITIRCKLFVKIFCVIFIAASVYFTFKCNLLISFICMIIGVAMTILLPKQKKLSTGKVIYDVALVTAVVVVLSSKTILFHILDFIEKILNSSIVTVRLEQLKTFVAYGTMFGDVSGRFELSLTAIRTFFQHPLFGIGPQNDWNIYYKTQLGLHATLWDDFARYGICGMALYFMAIWLLYRSASKKFTQLARKGYFIGLAEYFLISALNPTISVNVSIALFFVLPTCCQYISDIENRIKEADNSRLIYSGAGYERENWNCNTVW